MRFRLAVVLAVLTAVALPATASASEIIDRNASDVSLKVARQRAGARQLQRARQALERARLGRGERDPADDVPASRSSSSSTTRAATAPTSATSGRPSRTPAAPTTARSCSGSSPAARRPTAPTGRSSPGSAMLPELRPAGARKLGGLGASALALARRAAAADGQPELGLQALPPHLRLVHLPRQARARLQVDAGGRAARHVRPQPLPRHLQLGLRPGLEAREQLPDAQGHGQVLLRLLPATAPPRGARRALPRDDHRPRRDAGHLLGGRRRSAPTTRTSTCSSTLRRRSSSPATRSARPSSRPP